MSCPKLYPDNVYGNPPSDFDDDIHALADKVKEAVAGFGTDEDALIRELGDEPADRRYKLYYCYKEKFGADLDNVMRKELGGKTNLGKAMQLLVLPLNEAEATILHDAMKGLGTKEKLIMPIMCGRDNEEVVKLRETYFSRYGEDLGVKLGGELSGDFERMVFYTLQGLEKGYDEEYFSEEKIEADADAFYKAGQGSFGCDETSIFKIIGESPPEHLEKVSAKYTDKYEVTLIGALKTEVGGDAGKAARYAVGMKLKPYRTAAEHIEDACAGFGTDELVLTCALLRYQAIMSQVNDAHMEEFGGMSIVDRIKAEVHGKYERLLVKIVENSL